METNPVSSIPDPTEFTADPLKQQLAELFERGKNGAGWFYWVAALSLINSVIMLSGGDFGFALGLGVTLFADALAVNVPAEGNKLMPIVIAAVFDAVVLGMVALCGWLSQKRILPIFALGMFLYFLDGLIFVFLAFDIVSIGIHAFALFSMWNGFLAYRQLNQLERQLSSVPAIEPASFAG